MAALLESMSDQQYKKVDEAFRNNIDKFVGSDAYACNSRKHRDVWKRGFFEASSRQQVGPKQREPMISFGAAGGAPIERPLSAV